MNGMRIHDSNGDGKMKTATLCEHCVQPGEWDGYGTEPTEPVPATRTVRQPAYTRTFPVPVQVPECDVALCDHHANVVHATGWDV